MEGGSRLRETLQNVLDYLDVWGGAGEEEGEEGTFIFIYKMNLPQQ